MRARCAASAGARQPGPSWCAAKSRRAPWPLGASPTPSSTCIRALVQDAENPKFSGRPSSAATA